MNTSTLIWHDGSEFNSDYNDKVILAWFYSKELKECDIELIDGYGVYMDDSFDLLCWAEV